MEYPVDEFFQSQVSGKTVRTLATSLRLSLEVTPGDRYVVNIPPAPPPTPNPISQLGQSTTENT